MEELEAYLPTRYSSEQPIPNSAVLLIGLMSFHRTQGISSTQYHTFGQVAEAMYFRCRSICPHEVMHIVLDSYRCDSLRERPAWISQLGIVKNTSNTPIPKQMDKLAGIMILL